MRALFIVPSMDNGYWKTLGEKVGPKSEPLNLLYMATLLNKHGHHAEVLDAEAEGLSFDQIKEFIRSREPFDIVGVPMLTLMYSQCVSTCKAAREALPNAIIAVGGYQPTKKARETLERNKGVIDIAARGEAEKSMLELADALQNKTPYDKIQGLALLKDNEFIDNGEGEKVKDLDFFPIPDRGLIKMKLYRPSVSYYRRLPSYTMITTRGCPFRCTFCATAKTGYRMHSVPRVVEEMKVLVEEYGAKEILFRDDTFTLYRERTAELCDAIIEAGLHKKVKWDCITRAGLVTKELLTKMKSAGCWGIHFGVEGGTQKLLNNINKDSQLDHYRNAFRWSRELGIETRGYFMIGLPGSNTQDDLDTVKFAKEVDPDWAQFTITTPYPGTELAATAEKWGNFTKSAADWDAYQSWGGFSSENELPWIAHGRNSEELKKLQRTALKSFYFRPKVVLRKMRSLDNWAILKKYALGAMALASGGTGRPPE